MRNLIALILFIFSLATQIYAEEPQIQNKVKDESVIPSPEVPAETKPNAESLNEKKKNESLQVERKFEYVKEILRPRDKYLTFEYSNSNDVTDTKVNSGPTTSTQNDKVKFNISFGRNIGSIQTGVVFGFLNEMEDDKDDIKTKSSASVVGLEVRFNFIDNIPGNNFIPYVSVFAGSLSGTSKTDNVDKITLSGQGFGFGAGLEWFPFSEIFAVKIEGSSGKFNYKAKQGVKDLELNRDIKGLDVSFGLYF